MEFHAKHPSNPALSQLKYVNIKHSQRKKKKKHCSPNGASSMSLN